MCRKAVNQSILDCRDSAAVDGIWWFILYTVKIVWGRVNTLIIDHFTAQTKATSLIHSKVVNRNSLFQLDHLQLIMCMYIYIYQHFRFPRSSDQWVFAILTHWIYWSRLAVQRTYICVLFYGENTRNWTLCIMYIDCTRDCTFAPWFHRQFKQWCYCISLLCILQHDVIRSPRAGHDPSP